MSGKSMQKELQDILNRLADHEKRLTFLEGVASKPQETLAGGKTKTLRELIKGKKFSNGPEKIAAIVGYHEKIVGTLIKKDDLKREWGAAKFDGTYKTNLLDDVDGAYVRVGSSGECDLTQSGEDFFDRLINHESSDSTSR